MLNSTNDIVTHKFRTYEAVAGVDGLPSSCGFESTQKPVRSQRTFGARLRLYLLRQMK